MRKHTVWVFLYITVTLLAGGKLKMQDKSLRKSFKTVERQIFHQKDRRISFLL